MSGIFVCGTGAVSPAGWNVAAFREALSRGEPLPTKELLRPGNLISNVRQVPPPSPRPAFLAHPRLRRTSPIAHYAVSAAMEAIGDDAKNVSSGAVRLGIFFCALTGCVNYSRRFYDEVLKDPSTASPLVFPETVYNSPASHLAALLGTTAINYSIVGDPGTFVQGIALAAEWLSENRVDGCLVIGAEEMDWLTAGATRLFGRKTIFSDGAGALYFRRETNQVPAVRLKAVSDSHLFSGPMNRLRAIEAARDELNGAANGGLLIDGLQGCPQADRDEEAVWKDWPGARLSVKRILGEGFMAAAAWQCVAAVDALRAIKCDAATGSGVGTNQQAIGALFEMTEKTR
jgi:hypothetical protein